MASPRPFHICDTFCPNSASDWRQYGASKTANGTFLQFLRPKILRVFFPAQTRHRPRQQQRQRLLTDV